MIIFICGNLAGAYHKHLMELALQQTYQDTCNCIKSRIKLEFEKRQQVTCIFLLIHTICSSFIMGIRKNLEPLVARAQGWHLQTQMQ